MKCKYMIAINAHLVNILKTQNETKDSHKYY